MTKHIRDEVKEGLYEFWCILAGIPANPSSDSSSSSDPASSTAPSTATTLVAWAYVILLSPFIVELFGVGLAFALFVPLGVFFGLIEHKAPPLWVLFVLFINVGGIADIGTDILLLIKVMLAYWDYIYPSNTSQEQEHLDETESALFIARVCLTLIGAVPGIMLMIWAGAAKGSGAIGVLLLAILWKGIMGILRLVLIGFAPYVAYLRIRHQETPTHRNLLGTAELVLLADFCWSGLPLGVLTGLELFYYNKDALDPSDTLTLFEMIKLAASAVDIIAASYFIYFTLFGLDASLIGFSAHHPSDDGYQMVIGEKDSDMEKRIPRMPIQDAETVEQAEMPKEL